MPEKRPRGRPKGTGKDDRRYLNEVADLMLKKPDLKKTPAIDSVVAKHFKDHEQIAAARRILNKWNRSSDERMVEARERRAERRPRVNPASTRLAAGDVFAQMSETYSTALDPSFAVGSAVEKARLAIAPSVEIGSAVERLCMGLTLSAADMDAALAKIDPMREQEGHLRAMMQEYRSMGLLC